MLLSWMIRPARFYLSIAKSDKAALGFSGVVGLDPQHHLKAINASHRVLWLGLVHSLKSAPLGNEQRHRPSDAAERGQADAFIKAVDVFGDGTVT